MEMHEKIKMLRKERGYTQSQVADKIGQERSTVACYENGSRKPAVDVLEKLALLYGVTLDYFSNKSDSDIMLQLLAQSSEFFRSVGISEADKDAVYMDIMALYLESKKVGVANDDKTSSRGVARER
jgi:transcriptional regulator with XRE-family HTH domain